ncbi:uncharacterized protein TNCV_2390741 [Trichonephila clavipes]|nr:uncharacterized protein TNCV_2390741 [Trichonephila clavipes]
MVQNYVVRHPQSPRVAEQCDVNIQSLTQSFSSSFNGAVIKIETNNHVLVIMRCILATKSFGDTARYQIRPYIINEKGLRRQPRLVKQNRSQARGSADSPIQCEFKYKCFGTPCLADTIGYGTAQLTYHSWVSVDQALLSATPSVPSLHGGTVNSRRATSPFVRLVAGDERWDTPDPPSKLRWNRAKSYCQLYGAQGYGQRQAHI